MIRSGLIVLIVLLMFNLSGCASFSRPIPKVESIQAGQVVPERVRQYCSDIIKQCRTEIASAMQQESMVAGGASLGVNKQDEFDNRFMVCVRDREREKDCGVATVNVESTAPSVTVEKTSKKRKNK